MKIFNSRLFSVLPISAFFSRGQTNTKKKKTTTSTASSGSSAQNNSISAATYINANQLISSDTQKDQAPAKRIIKSPEPSLNDVVTNAQGKNILIAEPKDIEVKQKPVQKTNAHVTQPILPSLMVTADTTAPHVDITFATQKDIVEQPAKQQSTYANLSLGKQIWQTLRKVGLEVGLLKERKPWDVFLKEYKDVLHLYFIQADFNSIKQVLKAGEENVRYWYPDAALRFWQEMVAQVFAEQFQTIIKSISIGGNPELARDAILRAFPERKNLWQQEIHRFMLHHDVVDVSNTKDYVEFYNQTLLPAEKVSFVSGNSVKRLRLDIKNFVNSKLGKINQITLATEIEGLLSTLFNLPLTTERSNVIEYVLQKVYFLAATVYLKTKDKTLYASILEKIEKASAYHVFKPITVASSQELDRYDQLANLGDLFNEFIDKTNMVELFSSLSAEMEFKTIIITNKDEFLKTRFMDAVHRVSLSGGEQLKLKFAINKLCIVYRDYIRTANKESFDFNKYRVVKQTPFDVISKINNFFAESASFFVCRKNMSSTLEKLLAKVEFFTKNINEHNTDEVKKHFMSREIKFELNQLHSFLVAYGVEDDLDDLELIKKGLHNDSDVQSWLSHAQSKAYRLLKTVNAAKSTRIEKFHFQNLLPFKEPLVNCASPITKIIKDEMDGCWNSLLKKELSSNQYSFRDEKFLSALNRNRACMVQPEEDMISQVVMTV